MSQEKRHCRSTWSMMIIIALMGMLFYGGLSWIAMADSHATGIEGLKLFGDGRARFEMDDRKTSAGVDQERDRFRYRLRAGFTYTPNSYLEFGGRLTSGDTRDANSPHVILGSNNNKDNNTVTSCTTATPPVCTNPSDDYGFSRDEVGIDRAYIKVKYMDGFAWIGKEMMPLWTQNEYFWDADINPEGIAAGYTFKDVGPLTITAQGGYFVIDEGGWAAAGDPDVNLVTYQGVVKAGIDMVDVVVAYGVVSTDAGARVRFQNTTTTTKNDYSQASLQAKIKAIPDIPITVGYDLLSSDADTLDSGGVISLSGSYKDFSAALLIPDIETNAVTAFAQDDFPNYYNDFKGYEARVGYKIAKNINVDLRRYDAERKSDSKQTEARTQVNFNINF